MKKLAMLLAVLMLAVAAFSVSAFEDVKPADDCYDAVSALTALNVIKGKTETQYGPDDAVTRAQMAMLFTRLYTTISLENGENLTPFTDLTDGFYNSAIAWCYGEGVINGTSATTFNPEGEIIYQDALTMACRLLGYDDLTYPLGYITKARQLGLTAGLEGTAYDKALTRGEVAIVLYNALNADGAEKIEYTEIVSGFPFTFTRAFNIARDVYSFKQATYQIVATENFATEGNVPTEADSYILVKYDEEGNAIETVTKTFAELGLAEDTDGDANILGYIDVLFKGDKLDKKAVILSANVTSNLDADAEVAVYYKKVNGKTTAQPDKILIDGALANAAEKVLKIDENGIIAPVASLADYPVVFQANADDEGAYNYKALDVDADETIDYVIFFEKSFQKVTKAGDTIELSDADDEDVVVANVEVAAGDYVLAYKNGKFLVIDEVVAPVATSVSMIKNTTAGKVYTLASGDVVTYAGNNNPVLGNYSFTEITTPSTAKYNFYLVNGKVVLVADIANAPAEITYTPYTYALYLNYVVEKVFDETTADEIENVKMYIWKDGKVDNIPVKKETVELAGYPVFTKNDLITITGTDEKDGTYNVEAGIKAVDGFEEIIVLDGGEKLWYEESFKRWRLVNGDYPLGLTIEMDDTTRLYMITSDKKEAYTMDTFPSLPDEPNNLDKVVVRVDKDANGKVVRRTLVFALRTKSLDAAPSAATFNDYRIVLGTMASVDGVAYEVLVPKTGATEIIIDKVNKDLAAAHPVGALVYLTDKNAVDRVKYSYDEKTGEEEIFSGYMNDYKDALKLMQVYNIINGKDISAYAGTSATTVGLREAIYNGTPIVVIDQDEETGAITVKTVDDLNEIVDKVIRTYSGSDQGYVTQYVVIVPWQWAQAAGFTNLSAYADYVAPQA